MIVNQMTLKEAAVFSHVCKKFLGIFRARPHWKYRMSRLGRSLDPGDDPHITFRAAVNSTFVLWINKTRTLGLVRDGHLGSPEGTGFFPILQMGPLGHAFPHDFILGCINGTARVELCDLKRPNEFRLTDKVTPKRLIRAMLVVGNQLLIKVRKMRFLTGEFGFVQFTGQSSISIRSDTWEEFMGVFRTTCKDIDRTLGWIVSAHQRL